MAGGGGSTVINHGAAERRARLAGPAGFRGILANARVFFICLCCCVGGLLYGYNQGVFSSVLVMKNFDRKFASTVNSSGLKGMVTSILELGAWLGCFINSYNAEKLGRKRNIFVACIFFCIGVIVQTCAQNPAYLYCGRFITGMGVGNLSVGVPLHVAELAPAEIRGALVTLQQLSIEFGIMISFWIGYGTNYIGGTGESQHQSAWRLPLGLQLAPALFLMVTSFYLPESPRWLVNQGNDVEAVKVLAGLRRLPVDSELVQIEHLEVRAEYLFDVRTSQEKFPQYQDGSRKSAFMLELHGYLSLLVNPSLFKRVFAGAALMFFQQWNGINAVLYYAPTIFTNLGLTGNTISLLATGVVGIVMLIATIPTIMYLDTVGRKPILIYGAISMALMHTLIAILSGVFEHSWPDHKVAGWWAVVFVWFYAMSFGWSWGPIAWVYISEIFPLAARSKGMSVAASSNWMNNFIIGEITPTMLKHAKFGTYILFGSITYFAAFFVWYFLPETKGLTLEEGDIIWGDAGASGKADLERLAAIHEEIGLTRYGRDEKEPVEHHDDELEKSDSPV